MSQSELSVMTLNTWGFRWPLAKHRSLRFGRIAQHLNETTYDVVALQEMWDGARETLGQTALAWLQRPIEMARKGLRMHDSGLAVKLTDRLSDRAEVRADLARPYRRSVGWDWFKNKGVYAVDVELGEDLGRVTVMTTHLQAGKWFAKARRSQLDELLETAESVDNPIVLMGDFNFHSDLAEDRAAHDALVRAGFADAAQEIDRPEPTYLTANPYVSPSEQDERFDRIYLRDGSATRIAAKDVRVVIDHEAPMSDHEAVTARVVITSI